MDKSNRAVHCHWFSVLSPPVQLSVIGAATPSIPRPTRVFSTLHSRAPLYPSRGERDSDLPSKTIDRDVSRNDGGRIMVPVRRELVELMVMSTFPDRE